MLLNFIIDINSLFLTHECCIWRSWNLAASENHLWELQYAVLYDSSVIRQPIRLVEDRNNRNTLGPEPIDTRASIDWIEEVKAKYTGMLIFKFLNFPLISNALPNTFVIDGNLDN